MLIAQVIKGRWSMNYPPVDTEDRSQSTTSLGWLTCPLNSSTNRHGWLKPNDNPSKAVKRSIHVSDRSTWRAEDNWQEILLNRLARHNSKPIIRVYGQFDTLCQRIRGSSNICFDKSNIQTPRICGAKMMWWPFQYFVDNISGMSKWRNC